MHQEGDILRDDQGRYQQGHSENANRIRDQAGRWTPTTPTITPTKCRDATVRIVTLCDWHVPFEDRQAIRQALNFCEDMQPEIVTVHEIHDFYSLSRFDKDPSRIDSLQAELDQVVRYLQDLRAACPGSRIILLKSNHLDRLKRYLWAQAQALSSLRALEIPTLLGLDRAGIEYMDHFIYNNFLFKHGNLVSKDAGMTARRELQTEGMSGVSGHTHRLAAIYHRDRTGEYCWLESGCLCDLQPEYMDGRIANWKHGFSVVEFEGEKYNAKVIAI
jgi:hypothetical protein